MPSFDPVFERTRWRWLKNSLKIPLAVNEAFEIDGRQRAGPDGLSTDGPVLLGANRQQLRGAGGGAFLGQVEFDQRAALWMNEGVQAREVDHARIDHTLASGAAIDVKPDAHVALFDLEHDLGGFDALTADELAHRASVT